MAANVQKAGDIMTTPENAREHAESCLRTAGDTSHVSIGRAHLETLLAALASLPSAVPEAGDDEAFERGKDEGATYVMQSLADLLGVEFTIREGSETWDGDVWATMYSILEDARVVDPWDNSIAKHVTLHEERAALSPSEGAIPAGMVLREDAAQAAYRVCAETRHITLGDKAVAAIRALPAYTPKATPSEGRGGEEEAKGVELLRDALAEAFTAGATSVHDEWMREHILPRTEHPEFGEAASDYATLALDPHWSNSNVDVAILLAALSRGGVSLPDREGEKVEALLAAIDAWAKDQSVEGEEAVLDARAARSVEREGGK